MNRRILKKQCKRAMEILIAEHGYSPEAFVRSDGQETVSAPKGMDRRHVEHGSLHPGPLKGTMILWERTSYEYDEWDCALPSEVLKEIIFWNDFDCDAYEKVANDDSIAAVV